jgi:hypothetical protein
VAEIKDQKTSLLDSAIGPVAVTTTTYSKYDIDDFVTMTVQSKAEYLRMQNRAAGIDPQEVRNRPPVTIGGTNLGGYDG